MTASAQPHQALSWLLGARLQRIDSPKPDLFALSFFAQGVRQTLLLCFAPPLGAGLTTERPRGDAATPFVTKLRTKVENARVVRIEAWRCPELPERAHALELTLERNQVELRLLADFHPQHANLVLLTQSRTIVFSLHEAAVKAQQLQRTAPYVVSSKGRGVTLPDDATELERLGATIGQQATHGAHEAQRKAALAPLRAQRKRLERRITAIRGDVERAAKAPLLRQEAEALLCHLDEVSRGAASITLTEIASGEPLDIVLDPAKSAIDNATARFDRARKMERGVTIARQRLHEAEHEFETLMRQIGHIESADEDALRALLRAAGGGAPGKPLARSPAKNKPAEHKAYRVFETGQGRILVGKGAVDNDTLTLTVARPHDYWLHARGIHGAHVVIPLDRGRSLAAELLLDAAHLAAHFSDGRGEAQLEVQHTERRYVRKGRKSAPGAVQIEREKVLLLRVEKERIARLLKTERVEPPR
jgi:predicted ribosome quality control (RQC) complex YloA/Tae2 family protein